jgi:hypothetical protein
MNFARKTEMSSMEDISSYTQATRKQDKKTADSNTQTQSAEQSAREAVLIITSASNK